MIKYYKAWISYFALLAIINILGIASIPFTVENSTFFEVIWHVVTLIGLVGLFGYIKQVKIGSPVFWSAFLLVDLTLYFGTAVYGHLEAVKLYGELGKATSKNYELRVMLPLFIFLIPYWYGIFQYGFKSKTLWK
ncbi:MAG: hypothetical protein AMJ53_03390 [Gammaproteobacteria bacterium SG8_11]|nr:MAG: hypothetical protein AMJ53_03390 [Gammaproteobacteria bacterium SG8_11]